MPAKNSLKEYAPDSYYHLYNRGVEKREIFLDEQDFTVFLSYLKTYLLPKDIQGLEAILASKEAGYGEKARAQRLLVLNNFYDEIELHCYALLPNHFHLLIKQTSSDAIDRFLNSLGTRYTGYFNKKYRRVGRLYQGVYKAVRVATDEQLLHLSRYIHLNPFNWLSIPVGRWEKITLPFSLPDYFGSRRTEWIKTEQILSYFRRFSPKASYYGFLKEYADSEIIAPLTIDSVDN